MKRSLILTLVVTVVVMAAGCTAMQDRGANPYEETPFYAKYLDTGSTLDAQIASKLAALRADPNSPTLHNDLGTLLIQKNFPKDAVVEFERAVEADKKFYPAWYNLALVHASLDEPAKARRALERTVDLKPGHPNALFQLGLIAEKENDSDKAVAYYAKALRHNPRLLDIRANPRVLDSKLMHLALMRLYDMQHAQQSMNFQGPPAGYTPPPIEAPSPEAPARAIVTPAPPVTNPATQT